MLIAHLILDRLTELMVWMYPPNTSRLVSLSALSSGIPVKPMKKAFRRIAFIGRCSFPSFQACPSALLNVKGPKLAVIESGGDGVEERLTVI